MRDLDRVLADTTVFCNVAQAAQDTVLVDVLDYLDATLAIVNDVGREMDGLSRGRFKALRVLKTVDLVGEYLRGPALTLPIDLASQVEPIVKHRGIFPASAGTKNWGEVATILMASRLRVSVLTDDRAGQKFARLRGVNVLNTRRLVVEMHVHGALSFDDGLAVWNESQSTRAGRQFYERAIEDTQARFGAL